MFNIPEPQSSDPQTSTENPPEFDQVALELFQARVLTELEPDEQYEFSRLCLLATEIHDLQTEVQQAYHSHRSRLRAEGGLCERIEEQINSSLTSQSFTTTFLKHLQEDAILVDSLSGHGGFRDFMTSRFTRTFCQDILEHQLDAKNKLIACKIEIHYRFSAQMNYPIDDYAAMANYQSTVVTFFDREFRKYAADMLSPMPTNEDICKLRGQLFSMCFDGVRSLGRLFAHAQFLRRKLEAIEMSFLKIWLTLPIEKVNRASYPLAIIRDGLHQTRRIVMLLIARAMRFVHDDDQFVSYCRAEEDVIATAAELLYKIQNRIQKLAPMLEIPTDDFRRENMARKSSSFPTDPIEVRFFDKRVREGYDVFLVHDGTEDCIELAIRLQSEIQIRSFSCYMESTSDSVDDETKMSDQTEMALDDACVGVFLLTPEFAKRKSRVAQLRHMIDRVRNARVGWPGPTLIPVFFMVSIADCRKASEAGDDDEDAAIQTSHYDKTSHYDTRNTESVDRTTYTIVEGTRQDTDVDKEVAKKAFHYVTRYTGIENYDGARVDKNEELDERCMRLVRRTADAVAEACTTTIKEYSEQMQRTRRSEESDEQKEQHEGISDMILGLRRSQREEREKAILEQERDLFRKSTRVLYEELLMIGPRNKTSFTTYL